MKPMYSWRFSIYLSFLALTMATSMPRVAQSSNLEIPIVEASTYALNDASTLLNQGRIAYEAGRYTEAVKTWQKAEQAYQEQDNQLHRAISLNYLSLARQELGQWNPAENDIAQSLEILQGQPEFINGNGAVLAQALNTQGSLLLAKGQSEVALTTWQQAATIYENAGDQIGAIGSQINQAQALQALGLHRRSQKLLEEIAQDLEQQSDPLLKALGFRSLGSTLQIIGNLKDSQEMLQKSLVLTQELNLREENSITLLSLGNNARLLEDHQEAIAFYQQAALIAIRYGKPSFNPRKSANFLPEKSKTRTATS